MEIVTVTCDKNISGFLNLWKKSMADVPLYPLVGYGLCWGTKSPTHTPTPAKPVNIPQGFCYLCQSLVPSLVTVSLLRLFHHPPTFPTCCLYLIQQHPKVPSLLTVHSLRLFHSPPTLPTHCVYLIQQHPKFPRHHLYLIQWPPWGYPGLLVVCCLFSALLCLISFPFCVLMNYSMSM